MHYDISKIFGKLPARATSFEETVAYKDNMIILEIDPDVRTQGETRSKHVQFINAIVDILDEGDSCLPLLLKCNSGRSLRRNDTIHRTLSDGVIYSSYYKQINSRPSLRSIVSKYTGKLSIDGNILCFSNALLGFTFDYVYLMIFDPEARKEVNEITTEYGYMNVGRNNFGIQTLGLDKFDIPLLNPCTPVLDNEFSYVKQLDSTTKKIVELFSPVNYILCSYNNRLLDKGYFIRINSETNSIESTYLEILQFLDIEDQKMRMIYHGVTADYMKDNKLLLSGKLHQDCDVNLQLQSFLSEKMDVRAFLQGKFDRILWDDAIFFNENLISTFYDLGADFRFFNKKDYERFFRLCNRSHLITMASYVPEGENLSMADNIARVNSR